MRPLLEIIDTSGEPDTLSAIIDRKMQEPIIKLNGWQTIKAYAKEKQVSTQYISKLIRLDKIAWREYPELNNLRLVKDKND